MNWWWRGAQVKEGRRKIKKEGEENKALTGVGGKIHKAQGSIEDWARVPSLVASLTFQWPVDHVRPLFKRIMNW